MGRRFVFASRSVCAPTRRTTFVHAPRRVTRAVPGGAIRKHLLRAGERRAAAIVISESVFARRVCSRRRRLFFFFSYFSIRFSVRVHTRLAVSLRPSADTDDKTCCHSAAAVGVKRLSSNVPEPASLPPFTDTTPVATVVVSYGPVLSY